MIKKHRKNFEPTKVITPTLGGLGGSKGSNFLLKRFSYYGYEKLPLYVFWHETNNKWKKMKISLFGIEDHIIRQF